MWRIFYRSIRSWRYWVCLISLLLFVDITILLAHAEDNPIRFVMWILAGWIAISVANAWEIAAGHEPFDGGDDDRPR